MRKYIVLFLAIIFSFNAFSNPPGFACGTVSGLVAGNVTNSSAHISWNALPGALHYTIDYKVSSSGTWINIASGITTTSRNISGLLPATLYDCRVRAVCSDGPGTYAITQFVTGAPFYVCAGCPGSPSPPPAPPSATGYNYNTIISGGGADWNARVHLPWDYFLTTAVYQTIVFFPGVGEVGNDVTKLLIWGPHKYIAAGWNGNVKIDNDSVKFIIISLQPASFYPGESIVNSKLATIKTQFRVKPGSLHLTGLSHGGWCATTFVTADPYGGPYTYASQVASVVEVEGVQPGDNQPYPDLFDNFALSGGRLLGFEQTQDFRDIQNRVNRMNAAVPNSAIYYSTSFGNAGHCCFDNFYGSASILPGIFNLDGRNENIYQWMARQ